MPGGGLFEKDTKTHAMRRIALDEETLAVLETQRGVVEVRAAIASLDIGDDAYVFSREIDGSTPWRPDSVGKRFREIRDGLGLTNVRLHDLRHFAATRRRGWRASENGVGSTGPRRPIDDTYGLLPLR